MDNKKFIERNQETLFLLDNNSIELKVFLW